MKTKDNKRIVMKTITAMFVVLAFFVLQGAIVVINDIQGIQSAVIRGTVLWILAIITLLYYQIRYRDIQKLGFQMLTEGSLKRLLYFFPLLLISGFHFFAGISTEDGWKMILADIFLTLAIGMVEEIYFRGILCSMWMEKGMITAMLISSVLFGLCHLLNIAGGASLTATMLQIAFAFVYGMVFSLLFMIGKSIIPCVILHALHDFCSFISGEISLESEIILGSIQFLILIIYFIYLLRMVLRNEKIVDEKNRLLGNTNEQMQSE